MDKNQLKRLVNVEKRIKEIFEEDLGLSCFPIEFDIVPPQKMLEIMAYNIPTNISNWKKGRDYERERTIYDHAAAGLPYEVVINGDPARAYLMNNNKFAVQCLVIAHVYGHAAFFTHNSYFQTSRRDMVDTMKAASERFNKYEKRFGIDEVERTIDAGHALQFHSSPLDSNEDERSKRKRVFDQMCKKIHAHGGEYRDIIQGSKVEINEDVELFKQKLWRKLRMKTPIEPTSDILRYIIDNSNFLEYWQKDILEILRLEGQYYWPIIKTKFMNEGFAVMVHEKIMNQLFKEDLLTTAEHGDFNYANSLVKAEHPFQLNPYLLGSALWYDIENRWDKGQHGKNWEECDKLTDKDQWDTCAMSGWEKCKSVMKSHSDWFFLQEFLTADFINDNNIYIFEAKETARSIDYVITKDEAEEIRIKLLNAFAQNRTPHIEIINGDYDGKGWLELSHSWDGTDLDENYAKETMKHLAYLWGYPVILNTKQGDTTEVSWKVLPPSDGVEIEDLEMEKEETTTAFDVISPLEQTYLCPF